MFSSPEAISKVAALISDFEEKETARKAAEKNKKAKPSDLAAHDLMKAQVKAATDINNEKKKVLATLKFDTGAALENWKSSVFDMDVIALDDECANAEGCLQECSELISRWSPFVNYAPEDFSSNLESLKKYVDKVIVLCPTDSFVADYETKEKNQVQAGQAKVGDSAFAVVPKNSKSSNVKGKGKKARSKAVENTKKRGKVVKNKLKGFADGVQNVCSSSENKVTNNKFPPFTPLSPEEMKLIAEYSEGISNIFSGHMSTANNTVVTGMILMSTGDIDVSSKTLVEVKNPITTVSKPDPVHKFMNEMLNKIYKSSTSSSSRV